MEKQLVATQIDTSAEKLKGNLKKLTTRIHIHREIKQLLASFLPFFSKFEFKIKRNEKQWDLAALLSLLLLLGCL